MASFHVKLKHDLNLWDLTDFSRYGMFPPLSIRDHKRVIIIVFSDLLRIRQYSINDKVFTHTKRYEFY